MNRSHVFPQGTFAAIIFVGGGPGNEGRRSGQM